VRVLVRVLAQPVQKLWVLNRVLKWKPVLNRVLKLRVLNQVLKWKPVLKQVLKAQAQVLRARVLRLLLVLRVLYRFLE